MNSKASCNKEVLTIDPSLTTPLASSLPTDFSVQDSQQNSEGKACDLRQMFMRWQCRIRQSLVRESEGRPDAGIMPEVYLGKHEVSSGEDALDDKKTTFHQKSYLLGSIITLIHKSASFSVLPEIRHMARQSYDPAIRREQALRFFQAQYYQNADTFSDILTACFAPHSQGAKTIMESGQCVLFYNAYGHHFQLRAQVEKLSVQHYFFQMTWWHNFLFNPYLSEDVTILAFAIDWKNSRCLDDTLRL